MANVGLNPESFRENYEQELLGRKSDFASQLRAATQGLKESDRIKIRSRIQNGTHSVEIAKVGIWQRLGRRILGLLGFALEGQRNCFHNWQRSLQQTFDGTKTLPERQVQTLNSIFSKLDQGKFVSLRELNAFSEIANNVVKNELIRSPSGLKGLLCSSNPKEICNTLEELVPLFLEHREDELVEKAVLEFLTSLKSTGSLDTLREDPRFNKILTNLFFIDNESTLNPSDFFEMSAIEEDSAPQTYEMINSTFTDVYPSVTASLQEGTFSKVTETNEDTHRPLGQDETWASRLESGKEFEITESCYKDTVRSGYFFSYGQPPSVGERAAPSITTVKQWRSIAQFCDESPLENITPLFVSKLFHQGGITFGSIFGSEKHQSIWTNEVPNAHIRFNGRNESGKSIIDVSFILGSRDPSDPEAGINGYAVISASFEFNEENMKAYSEGNPASFCTKVQYLTIPLTREE